ncbi:MAG: PspC domain-containing protein [Crocinitomicaceae bacterium]
MKKTITVNIGGFSFVINETAYENLQMYLSNVERKLSGDSAEIMQDIESRIAELLKERLAESREVVDDADIDYIQSVMGQPEDYAEEGVENDSFNADEHIKSDNAKSLYRDMDEAVLGGVCSGLAKYFNIDPLVMRILFVFFAIFAGSGLLLYIILLILIPAAKTTAEKLKMSGESVNLESIKSHFNKVGTDLNEKIKSKKFSQKVNSATSKTVQTVSTVARVFGKIIGIGFIIAGIVSLIFLVLYLTGSGNIIPFTSFIVADSFYDFLAVIFPSEIFVNMSVVSLLFVIGIPLVSIVLIGVRLVFEVRTKVPTSVKIGSFIVFGIAFSILCTAVLRTGAEFSQNGSSSALIEATEVEKLKINVVDDSSYFKSNSAYNCCDYMVIKQDVIALKNVSLYVEEGSDSINFQIKTIAKSQGMTHSNSVSLAKEIQYNLKLEGSELTIPSFSTIARKAKYRGQRIKIIIKVPKGKSVDFTGELQTINCFVDGDRRYRHISFEESNYNDAVWRSVDGEMQCVDCWD